jgi:hypothetical protein
MTTLKHLVSFALVSQLAACAGAGASNPTVSGSHADENGTVHFTLKGDRAKQLEALLEQAGVASTSVPDATFWRAQSLRCTSSFVSPSVGLEQDCEIVIDPQQGDAVEEQPIDADTTKALIDLLDAAKAPRMQYVEAASWVLTQIDCTAGFFLPAPATNECSFDAVSNSTSAQ